MGLAVRGRCRHCSSTSRRFGQDGFDGRSFLCLLRTYGVGDQNGDRVPVSKRWGEGVVQRRCSWTGVQTNGRVCFVYSSRAKSENRDLSIEVTRRFRGGYACLGRYTMDIYHRSRLCLRRRVRLLKTDVIWDDTIRVRYVESNTG